MPGHAFLRVRLPGLGPQPIPSSRTPSSAVFYLTPLSGASPGCRPLLGPTVSLLLWGVIKGIYTSLRLLLLILQRLRCESPLEDRLPASAIWLSEVSVDPQSFPSLLLESYLARRPALSRWPLRLCLASAPPPPHPLPTLFWPHRDLSSQLLHSPFHVSIFVQPVLSGWCALLSFLTYSVFGSHPK